MVQRLVFLHFAGLQKVYKVPCTDSEILQATVDKEGLSITVIGQADEFNRCDSLFVLQLQTSDYCCDCWHLVAAGPVVSLRSS